MRLEFLEQGDPLPTNIAVAGYPLHVPYSSTVQNNDMYLALGQATTHPGNWELIDYNAFISDGNGGSPIFYQNTSSKLIRAIGIATTGSTGVLLTSRNRGLIRSWMAAEPPAEYQFQYYVPYYHQTGTIWTGLALANPYRTASHIKVEYFAPNGEEAGYRFVDLVPGSQFAFPCYPDLAHATGWVRVSATKPLFGLALVGESGPMSTMFDMDLKDKLHQLFLFPHLASLTKEKWTSTVMLCNPNAQSAELSFEYHDMEGNVYHPATTSPIIPANGSVEIDAGKLFNRDLNNGYLLLHSTQPLAAFLLYDNTATGTNHWKAGLSAVPLN
jgi:hypothetical protein